jgi:hypothetical protein
MIAWNDNESRGAPPPPHWRGGPGTSVMTGVIIEDLEVEEIVEEAADAATPAAPVHGKAQGQIGPTPNRSMRGPSFRFRLTVPGPG